MNFLSQFYFLTPIVHEILAVLKANKNEQISENGVATPAKFGLHAFHVNLYLHEIFEAILFFDPHGL